jgi:sugar phosphate permease
MAAMTFALGGLAQWLPTFLYRMHSLDVGRANTLFGAITFVAGITGTLAGGWLGALVVHARGFRFRFFYPGPGRCLVVVADRCTFRWSRRVWH